MEPSASTSNEGSKKRNLSEYQELKTKKVSNKSIEKSFDLKGFSALNRLNCMSFDVKTNQRDVSNESNPVSSSSADSLIIDLEAILENGVVISKPRVITPEIAPKIEKRRAKAQKQREEEKEAREAEEMEAMKKRKEIEETENSKEKRNQIKMQTNARDDKDAI